MMRHVGQQQKQQQLLLLLQLMLPADRWHNDRAGGVEALSGALAETRVGREAVNA
jgi:hypothetical protein